MVEELDAELERSLLHRCCGCAIAVDLSGLCWLWSRLPGLARLKLRDGVREEASINLWQSSLAVALSYNGGRWCGEGMTGKCFGCSSACSVLHCPNRGPGVLREAELSGEQARLVWHSPT